MLRLLSIIAVVIHVVVLPCDARENPDMGAVQRAALRSIAGIRAQPSIAANTDQPLELSGVVTMVDEVRNLLVLQDETGAVAIHSGSKLPAVAPGRWVSLKARSCAPFVGSCPGYPFFPAGRETLPSFEMPQNEGDFRLNRMRALLRPEVSGDYTFWIASDDSSELWLSPNANPGESSRVAMVPTGSWTDPHEWSRLPSQRSKTFHLRGGESYYIEALQEQLRASCHLEVAWAGPGVEQAVIDGRFLTPLNSSGEAAGERGVLREFWTDYATGTLEPVSNIRWSAGELIADGLEIVDSGGAAWPIPLRIEPCQALEKESLFRWVEGEGAVGWIAADRGGAMIEVVSGTNRMQLRVAHWDAPLPGLSQQLRVKFRGVCEGGFDLTRHLIAGFVTAPTRNEVTFFEDTGSRPFDVVEPSTDASTEDSSLGGYYFTRGVVTFSDRVFGKDRLFVQEAMNGVFISQEERKLLPAPHVGQCVEVGGNFQPRKAGPAMRPAAMNIIGWQSFPNPVTPSSSSEFRDGQWTELEGVARAVRGNGTMTLSGRETSVQVWIGGAGSTEMQGFVNSRLRIRGVMSLDTLEVPVLLVPALGFVEISEAAPDLPEQPMSVVSLGDPDRITGWVHLVKLAGTVTHTDGRSFFLQDASGGLRVELLEETAPKVASVVEVVGFPGKPDSRLRLSEAVCLSQCPGSPLAPLRLEPEHVDPTSDGMLATTDARILSQKQRGTALVLELQSNRHVFQATMNSPNQTMPVYETGSLLSVTGVCLLDSPGSAGGVQRLLLRSSSDVTFLHGPPWWNWKRTVALIGGLLAVLMGSLLRILIMNRRFAREQEARLAFTRGMLESQESERRRIAASLHDSLGQELLVIRNQTHLASQDAPENGVLRQRLEQISDTTLQAIGEVREITHNLRPYQLDRLGLSQSIRALVRKVGESTPVEIACHVDGIDGVFDNDSEIHIYRIVQEGLNNVIKHSEATEAAVVLKNGDGALTISIRDNGRGIAANGIPKKDGFGLGGIKERVEILGGNVRRETSPGQGLTLRIQIPLQKTPK